MSHIKPKEDQSTEIYDFFRGFISAAMLSGPINLHSITVADPKIAKRMTHLKESHDLFVDNLVGRERWDFLDIGNILSNENARIAALILCGKYKTCHRYVSIREDRSVSLPSGARIFFSLTPEGISVTYDPTFKPDFFKYCGGEKAHKSYVENLTRFKTHEKKSFDLLALPNVLLPNVDIVYIEKFSARWQLPEAVLELFQGRIDALQDTYNEFQRKTGIKGTDSSWYNNVNHSHMGRWNGNLVELALANKDFEEQRQKDVPIVELLPTFLKVERRLAIAQILMAAMRGEEISGWHNGPKFMYA